MERRQHQQVPWFVRQGDAGVRCLLGPVRRNVRVAAPRGQSLHVATWAPATYSAK